MINDFLVKRKKLNEKNALRPWESYRNGNIVPNRQEYFHIQKKN